MYIDEIAKINGVDVENVYLAVQKDVRETILEAICMYMKKSKKNALFVRKIYHRYENNLDAARLVVRQVCGCTLTDEEIRWIDQCLRASMRKQNRRKQYTQPEREAIWQKQKGECAICGQPVPFGDSHLDHIVPWDFVGDELPDNLQILCSECNWKKGIRLGRELYNTLCMKKGGSKQ